MNTTDGPSTPRQTISTNPCVLVVEDDEDSRHLMKVFLEMRGWTILEVENGEQALALTEEMPPDLIIINISLPVDDGLAMLRQIHEHSLLHNVPIIVTSGYALPAFRLQALQAGGNAFFAKPLEFDQLDMAISRCLPVQDRSHRKLQTYDF